MNQIYKPNLVSVPLEDGLKWRAGEGWIYQEKLDGVWHEKPFGNSILCGELVRGTFTAFDVVIYQGQDVRREPLRARLNLLRGFDVPIVKCGSGGEFLEAILRESGEGIVAKHLECRFGQGWYKCKRIETFDCVVLEKHETKQSVHLELNGQDCGWCSVQGRNFDRVNVGDVVEVKCQSVHVSGKLREPRFVRVRRDKPSC